MKLLNLFILFLLSGSIFGQVKLTPKTFDNGFKYPVVVLSPDKTNQEPINKKILESVSDLEASDFCIGEYGFVQKGNHLEIHIFCTCIDLDESEHRYLLFNLETGEMVSHDDLFDPKQKKKALAAINTKIKAYSSSDETCKTDFGKLNSDIQFEDLSFRLHKDGLEVRPEGTKSCEATPLHMSWVELSKYLKIKFI